jgi:hypothetical protein
LGVSSPHGKRQKATSLAFLVLETLQHFRRFLRSRLVKQSLWIKEFVERLVAMSMSLCREVPQAAQVRLVQAQTFKTAAARVVVFGTTLVLIPAVLRHSQVPRSSHMLR